MKKIWRNLLRCKKSKADSKNSWSIETKDVNKKTFDLSVENPSKGGEVALREPKDILEEMKNLNKEISSVIEQIEENFQD